MRAYFDGNGGMKIFGTDGRVLTEGVLGAWPLEPDYNPMLEWAIELMKQNGDWPEDPYVSQIIDLED